MIISEKQIWRLLDIAQEYAIQLGSYPGKLSDYSLSLASFIREIKEQQSGELKNIGDKVSEYCTK